MPPLPLPPLSPTLYTGTFISTPSLSSSLQVLENYAVGVDEEGVIRFVCELEGGDGGGVKEQVEMLGWDLEECRIVEGGKGGNSWWFPGFVDTHIHASQYPNAGIFGKTTLLDWLHTYTFPLESSLSSLPLARRVYSRCVSRTLSHGTTTASYFATLHVESTNLLADICLQKGQRAFIGRVCMDSDLSPSYIRDESPEKAIADTEATIAHINAIDPNHNLITPILTPRFAPSCTSPLLHQLGHLASTTHLPIQTHISENPSEISLVHSLFPTHTSYAHVYDTHSLLTPRTVLAHAIHLSPSERALIKHRQSSISHCPVSNTSLSSGLCPVRELLDQGITVGLGTDVSGGYSSSILTAAREAGMVSRTVAALTPDEDSQDQEGKEVDGSDRSNPEEENKKKARYSTTTKDLKKLSVEECLYLATRGGAACLNLSHKIGAFEVGMEWDAQLIQLSNGVADDYDDEGVVELWGKETWGEKVAKWLFCGDDRNTRRVYVRGRLVYERDGGGKGGSSSKKGLDFAT